MLSEQGVLALVRVIGTVVVLLTIIMTFGPTINMIIRKKFALDKTPKNDNTVNYLRDLESNSGCEVDPEN